MMVRYGTCALGFGRHRSRYRRLAIRACPGRWLGGCRAGAFLSDAELARLSAWPTEMVADDLVTFFSLTDDDVA